MVALRYEDRALWALDQTLLPWREVELELRTAEQVATAIKRLAIRGAPLIGVAAAYGVALELARDPDGLARACDVLAGARPTAVNLAYAVERVRAAVVEAGGDAAEVALAQARLIEAQETSASDAIAAHGADVLADCRRILTHCNTGALAAPGRGTALAVVAELAQRGSLELVLASESRPLLQGARLTVYELRRLGIAHELLVDGAAAGLIAAGEVDAVIVGCDRVAANGDVANKVGTYCARAGGRGRRDPVRRRRPDVDDRSGVHFGEQIVIEERDGDEVSAIRTGPGGDLHQLTIAGTPCRNPAFDLTPAALVTALVTERGVVRPASGGSVLDLLSGAEARVAR